MQPVDVAAHEILIHTSVKLVTAGRRTGGATAAILIHTSVKLVTHPEADAAPTESILIHTSVKLVTGLTYVGLT